MRSPDFPHYQFLGFWAIHLLVVWAAVYLTWGRRMRPQWRSYRIAILVTLMWAAFTFTFNSIAGTDYGFLNEKPATASLLDLLGPWPVYIYIHCGHADSHRMGSNDMAVGANTATRQGRSAAGLAWPSQAIFAYESAASARVTRSAKAQRVPATYRCCIKCNVGAADTSRGSWG